MTQKYFAETKQKKNEKNVCSPKRVFINYSKKKIPFQKVLQTAKCFVIHIHY
jgi:hypothetical protein